MSCYLFEYLEGFHIPTFFVEKLSPLRMMVKRIEPIPLYVKIFNTGRGVFSGRFGIKQDISLDFPIIEHYYKNGTENSSWVNEYHVHALDIATPEEFKQINRIASKINAVLRGLCDRRQLVLADSQLKFGRWKGQIVLGDELSPTTCHFLDLARGETSQRDRFQVGQEAGEEAWGELCDRLMSKV
ncbi:MAG: phosphoribosylaminoimidazolesuccinocarboxamide synthase [Ignavibacteriales bacterium]|nr:phosphoribosylaminoimidazolesuccinocarboxamide synthase [Ignavibacteriales bacterium]